MLRQPNQILIFLIRLRRGNPKREAFAKSFSVKKLFYKILQMSQERTFDEDLFRKVAAASVFGGRTLSQVFSYEV